MLASGGGQIPSAEPVLLSACVRVTKDKPAARTNWPGLAADDCYRANADAGLLIHLPPHRLLCTPRATGVPRQGHIGEAVDFAEMHAGRHFDTSRLPNMLLQGSDFATLAATLDRR